MDEHKADPSKLLREGAEQAFDSLDEQRAFAAVSESLLGRPEDPATLDRFQIERRVGSGGMGVVYAAFDPQLGRKVALKLLKPERSSAKDQERLVDEAKALARLNHPNIVGVHEIGSVGERVFIAMELVEGVPMSVWLRTPRSWRDVARVALETGRGLATAHEAGIVHRDFKPANVMLRLDGQPVVLDFGLARWHGQSADLESSLGAEVDGNTLETFASAIAGTPAYMAPEQHQGLSATAKSDQFSFCVSIYEAAYGHRPFDAATRHELLEAIESGKPCPGPRSRRIPPWFKRLLLRGLHPDPSDRWPSMETMLETLQQRMVPITRRLAVPGAVLGSIGVAAVATAADRGPSCADESEAIDNTWSAETKHAVQETLGSVEHRAAKHIPGVVADQLDTYSTRWSQTWVAACESKRTAKDNDDAGRRTLECLQGQREGLESTLRLFESPTVQLLLQAPRMLPTATTLQSCIGLEGAPNLASTAEREDRGADVERVLNEAAAFVRIGETQRAEDALDELSGLTDPGLRSRIVHGRGQIFEERGDIELARLAFEDAILEAERAGDTVARLAAMRSLAGLFIETGDLAAAEHMLARVDAAHERFPNRPWTWSSELLDLQVRILQAQGEMAASVTAANARLEMIRREMGEDQDYLLRGQLVVVQAKLRAKQWDGQELQLDAIIEGTTALYGPIHELNAIAYSQRGSLASSLGDSEKAIRDTRRSLEIRTQLGGGEAPMLKTLGNLAIMHARRGELDDAEASWKRIVTFARAHEPAYDRRLLKTVHNLAGLSAQRGDKQGAVEYEREALELHTRLDGKDHGATVMAMYELGRAMNVADDVDGAIPTFEKGLITERRVRGTKTTTYALLLSGLADAYANAGNMKERLANAEAAYQVIDLKTAGPKLFVDVNTGYVLALLSSEEDDAKQRADEVLRLAETAAEDRRVGPQSRKMIALLREDVDARK